MPPLAGPPAKRLWPLAILLLVYFLIGALYAVETPAWQAPDEPAHYNYIRHLVEQRALPILQPGDYDAAYLERLKSERFPPALPIASVRYEAWQPPLYYLLAAPVFALSGGSLLAVRLFTLALGGGVIALTWALAQTIFPSSPLLRVAAAGFVAFLPQHLAMLAAANNDALAEVVIALGLLLALRAVMPARPPGQRPQARPTDHTPIPPAPAVPSGSHTPTRLWLGLGFILGAAFLTKLSAYPLAALFAAALLLAARREQWDSRQVARTIAQVFVPALLIGGAWWARNLSVYGGLDFLGLARHDAVVQGQLRTSEAIALWGAPAYVATFVQTTFQSWWGQFGWMGVVMDRRVYLALLAYSLALAVGLGGAILAWKRVRPSPRGRGAGGEGELPIDQDALALLGLHAALTVAVYLYYNLSFVQFQGRYLFPALPVVALAAAVALRQWARWLMGLVRLPEARLRAHAEWTLALLPILLTAALAVFALYRFIVPQLRLP